MATLPTRDDLGGLPSVRTNRVTPQIRVVTPNLSAASEAKVAASRQMGEAQLRGLDRVGASQKDLSNSKIMSIQTQGEAGVAVGDGLQNIGKAFANISEILAKKQEQEDALTTIQEKAKYDFDVTRFRLEQAKNPASYDTRADEFEEYTNKRGAEYIGKLPASVQEEKKVEWSITQFNALNEVSSESDAIKKEHQLASLDIAAESKSVEYAAAKTSGQRASALRDLTAWGQSMFDAGLFSSAQWAAYRTKYVDGVVLDDAKTLWKSDPQELVNSLDGRGNEYKSRLRKMESEGRGGYKAVNTLGYAGADQFGAERLTDLGFYTPGPNEKYGKWRGDKWSGTFHIPGFEGVKNLQDFLENGDAQDFTLDKHLDLSEKEIRDNGFDKYIGETIQGVPITKEGLLFMLHLGGVDGTKRALLGQSNDKDAYGTGVLKYAAAGVGLNRFSTLDAKNRAIYQNAAERSLATEPDLRLARAEISKTGYDMVFAEKMEPSWLEANRDIISTSDYKVFLNSMKPGTNRKLDPNEYLRLYALADDEPEEAMNLLKEMYGRDEMAKDDFRGLFSQAKANLKSTRGRPYATELRQYIRQNLAPSTGVFASKTAYVKQLDALYQFEDWYKANKSATRGELRTQAQIIINDYRRIKYETGMTELPPPRFVTVTRDKIDEATLSAAKAATVKKLKSGNMTRKDAAEQAALLRRWGDLLKYRDKL